MDQLPDQFQRLLSSAIGSARSLFSATGEQNNPQKSESPRRNPHPPSLTASSDSAKNRVERKNSVQLSSRAESVPMAEFASKLMPFGAKNDPNAHLTMATISNSVWHVFVIHCKKHKRFAVSKARNNQAQWLPFLPISKQRTLAEGSAVALRIILCNGDLEMMSMLKEGNPLSTRLLEMRLIQLPAKDFKTVTRCIWYVSLDEDLKELQHFNCCQENKELVWFTSGQLQSQKYIWGQEICDFVELVGSRKSMDNYVCKGIDVTLADAIKWVPSPNDKQNLENELFYSLGLTTKDFENLYGIFLRHSFPALTMSLHSYKIYMKKNTVEPIEKIELLFNGSDTRAKRFLQFSDFALGLVCSDKASEHNRVRAEFVFRAYDTERRGHLDLDQMLKLIRLITPDISDKDARSKVEAFFSVFKNRTRPVITQDDLIFLIGRHHLRGTSTLLRLKCPMRALLNESTVPPPNPNLCNINIMENVDSVRCFGCMNDKTKPFEYVMQITSNGKVSSVHLPRSKHPSLVDKITDEAKKEEKATYERLMFDAWQIIQEIKAFSPKRMVNEVAKGIYQDNDKRIVDFFQSFINVFQKRYEAETMCVKVKSPCTVIGDIHGNIADLLSLEKYLWKNIPFLGKNLVFLGDYVDRGRWGIECFLYVVALKTLLPDQITLLRGNHEIRTLQNKYSFTAECLEKYGPTRGALIQELANKVMDFLPISAVIDGNVFCAHGGIPHESLDLANVRKLAIPMPNPFIFPIAWEILWSDPVTQEEFLQMCCAHTLDPDKQEGFIRNFKRDAGYVFNEEGVDAFFTKNNLTFIVRAHQAVDEGYDFNFDGKCTTIFSCSHYCNKLNVAAVMNIFNQRLRVLQIDTSMNPSATD